MCQNAREKKFSGPRLGYEIERHIQIFQVLRHRPGHSAHREPERENDQFHVRPGAKEYVCNCGYCWLTWPAHGPNGR